MILLEPRCKVCQLREFDPEFYQFLFSKPRSLRELQKEVRKKFEETKNDIYYISYSSFRRHILAGEKHYD